MKPLTIGAWSHKWELELEIAYEQQTEFKTFTEFCSEMYEQYIENFYNGMEYL